MSGEPVSSAEGLRVAPDVTGWDGGEALDLVMLGAGFDPLQHLPMGLRGFLSRADAKGATLGGFEAGAVVLAELGLLKSHQAVLVEEARPHMRENWPEIALSEAPISFDRARLTAGGGLASGEAMLAWIAHAVSPALAAQVSAALALGRIEEAGQHQEMAQSDDPILTRMLAIMASQLQDPLPLDSVARALEISPKQMRSRCQKGLGKTPQHAYLDLRLQRARQLIANTELPVQDIAQATGFASSSAFTRSYRTRYGETPRSERAARHRPDTAALVQE
ncbi:MAG: helix-turn-helix domain-containing protein [Pelagimonas sp.]|nr:helix-turn-helix domain-containing protein [Pelagimonas sp.]